MATLPLNNVADDVVGSIRTFGEHGFIWKQGSVYINPDGGLVELFTAMEALKAIPWFPKVVRELRAFRLENNSEFTDLIKH